MSNGFRIKSTRDSFVKATFGESVRCLAKSYYPYIYSDSRNISKSIVDLQAAFEICTESLNEFERTSSEMSSITYALFGIEQALFRSMTELNIIREEVVDLLNALRSSEKFNLRLLDQLSNLDEALNSGITSAKSVLSFNKTPANMVGVSSDHYLIPKTTRETLEAIIDIGKPSAYSTFGVDTLLKDRLSPDLARMNWLIHIQRELAQRHAEFSFLELSLWSEQVRDNFHLATRKRGCGPKPTAMTSYDWKKRKHSGEEGNLLRMASSARIDELSTVVQTIQGRVFELGGIIMDELNRLRSAFEETKLQHKTLNAELGERRRQLIESLLATHSAVQTLLDMDERNDALVGKLVKTRPLFAELYRIVQSDATTTERSKEVSPTPTLGDLVGSQNWRLFIEQLSNIRLNADEATATNS